MTITPNGEVHDPTLVYNTSDDTYNLAFVYINNGISEIRTSSFTGTGSVIQENLPLYSSSNNQVEPIMSHNGTIGDDYVIWGEDSSMDSIMGLYRTTSGSALEIASTFVDIGSNHKSKHLMDLSGMQVFWIEMEEDAQDPDFYIKTQKISDNNTLDGSVV